MAPVPVGPLERHPGAALVALNSRVGAVSATMRAMKISDGPAAFLATLVGAGLAVGAVYGGHMFLGDYDGGPGSSPGPSSSPNMAGDDMVVYSEEWAGLLEDAGWEFSLDEGPLDKAVWVRTPANR